MKKSFLLSICSVLLISFSTSAQTGWVKEKVDEKLSAKFPSKPTKEETSLNLKTEDSTVYMVNVLDLGTMGLDSATLATMAPTEEFAEQFKGGFAKKSEGSEITKMDIGKWKDYTAYDIEISDDNKKLKMYMKCIFINTKLYMFLFVTKNSSSNNTTNKEAFFNNIELN